MSAREGWAERRHGTEKKRKKEKTKRGRGRVKTEKCMYGAMEKRRETEMEGVFIGGMEEGSEKEREIKGLERRRKKRLDIKNRYWGEKESMEGMRKVMKKSRR